MFVYRKGKVLHDDIEYNQCGGGNIVGFEAAAPANSFHSRNDTARSTASKRQADLRFIINSPVPVIYTRIREEC